MAKSNKKPQKKKNRTAKSKKIENVNKKLYQEFLNVILSNYFELFIDKFVFMLQLKYLIQTKLYNLQY